MDKDITGDSNEYEMKAVIGHVCSNLLIEIQNYNVNNNHVFYKFNHWLQ
jgi:hypothetical protein